MSYLMKQFLAAYLAWIESGAPDHEPFSRSKGLCGATNRCPRAHGEPHLYLELEHMFGADGLDLSHPFGADEYYAAAVARTQHQHEPRLAWIRSKLAVQA